MGMPVESSAVRMNGAEYTGIQPAFSCRIQQVVDRHAAEVVKQPAIGFEEWPERVGQGKDQMLPVAVRQAVKLGGNPQVCGLFTAGRTGTAVARVGDVFNMVATGIITAIFLNPGDAGAAGQHFGDGFDFDITQAAGIQEGGPALVGGEELFKRAGAETRNHGAD